MGFAALGEDVLLSRDARVYQPGRIRLGSRVRIDDFCILSGTLEIGCNVHLAPGAQIAAGAGRIRLHDFVGCSYNVLIIASSDDYRGASLSGPTVPDEFKPSKQVEDVEVGRHVIVGAGSTVLPGSALGEGAAVGAMSLVKGLVPPWTLVAGVPARKRGERDREGVLGLEAAYAARLEATLRDQGDE